MEERYNFSDIEQRAHSLWSKSGNTSPASASNKKTYSMFLIPPNASGPLHIGNALMIAIQDVIARYHRSKGDPTLWIPGTDHGGYETQVTYEREVGDIPDSESRAQVYSNISKFVDNNNKTIVRQITSMGASVDWSRFRFTLDDSALRSVNGLFNKMVSDNLIYRSSYMVNYCTSCATVLADIELKEVETTTALYHIKFPIQHTEEFLTFITTRPEFLFSITHALVHPQDTRFSNLIGKVLINPVTGSEIAIVESKRKFDPANLPEYLPVFSPSSKKYDFEYAIRNNIPTRDLLNWDGTLLEYMPGAALLDARETILTLLASNNFLGEVKNHTENIYLCKKGHTTQNIIRMTWFLNLDSNEVPLRLLIRFGEKKALSTG
jgi:valyl-tRNA synthetase